MKRFYKEQQVLALEQASRTINTTNPAENTNLEELQDLAEVVKVQQESLINELNQSLENFNFKSFDENHTKLVGQLIELDRLLSEKNLDDSQTWIEPTVIDQLKFVENRYKECIKPSLDKVKQLHLLHGFASEFPGLEHKGGVPVGGTFILVYVERNEIEKEVSAQTSIILETEGVDRTVVSAIENKTEDLGVVIGDFYLPYSCHSSCPPPAYLINQPEPFVIINRSVFCADPGRPGEDPVRHEIEIKIAIPSGVVLLVQVSN